MRLREKNKENKKSIVRDVLRRAQGDFNRSVRILNEDYDIEMSYKQFSSFVERSIYAPESEFRREIEELRRIRSEYKKELVMRVLRESSGDYEEAARVLGRKYSVEFTAMKLRKFVAREIYNGNNNFKNEINSLRVKKFGTKKELITRDFREAKGSYTVLARLLQEKHGIEITPAQLKTFVLSNIYPENPGLKKEIERLRRERIKERNSYIVHALRETSGYYPAAAALLTRRYGIEITGKTLSTYVVKYVYPEFPELKNEFSLLRKNRYARKQSNIMQALREAGGDYNQAVKILRRKWYKHTYNAEELKKYVETTLVPAFPDFSKELALIAEADPRVHEEQIIVSLRRARGNYAEAVNILKQEHGYEIARKKLMNFVRLAVYPAHPGLKAEIEGLRNQRSAAYFDLIRAVIKEAKGDSRKAGDILRERHNIELEARTISIYLTRELFPLYPGLREEIENLRIFGREDVRKEDIRDALRKARGVYSQAVSILKEENNINVSVKRLKKYAKNTLYTEYPLLRAELNVLREKEKEEKKARIIDAVRKSGGNYMPAAGLLQSEYGMTMTGNAVCIYMKNTAFTERPKLKGELELRRKQPFEEKRETVRDILLETKGDYETALKMVNELYGSGWNRNDLWSYVKKELYPRYPGMRVQIAENRKQRAAYKRESVIKALEKSGGNYSRALRILEDFYGIKTTYLSLKSYVDKRLLADSEVKKRLNQLRGHPWRDVADYEMMEALEEANGDYEGAIKLLNQETDFRTQPDKFTTFVRRNLYPAHPGLQTKLQGLRQSARQIRREQFRAAFCKSVGSYEAAAETLRGAFNINIPSGTEREYIFHVLFPRMESLKKILREKKQYREHELDENTVIRIVMEENGNFKKAMFRLVQEYSFDLTHTIFVHAVLRVLYPDLINFSGDARDLKNYLLECIREALKVSSGDYQSAAGLLKERYNIMIDAGHEKEFLNRHLFWGMEDLKTSLIQGKNYTDYDLDDAMIVRIVIEEKGDFGKTVLRLTSGWGFTVQRVMFVKFIAKRLYPEVSVNSYALIRKQAQEFIKIVFLETKGDYQATLLKLYEKYGIETNFESLGRTIRILRKRDPDFNQRYLAMLVYVEREKEDSIVEAFLDTDGNYGEASLLLQKRFGIPLSAEQLMNKLSGIALKRADFPKKLKEKGKSMQWFFSNEKTFIYDSLGKKNILPEYPYAEFDAAGNARKQARQEKEDDTGFVRYSQFVRGSCPDCGGKVNRDFVHAEFYCESCGLVNPLLSQPGNQNLPRDKETGKPEVRYTLGKIISNRLIDEIIAEAKINQMALIHIYQIFDYRINTSSLWQAISQAAKHPVSYIGTIMVKESGDRIFDFPFTISEYGIPRMVYSRMHGFKGSVEIDDSSILTVVVENGSFKASLTMRENGRISMDNVLENTFPGIIEVAEGISARSRDEIIAQFETYAREVARTKGGARTSKKTVQIKHDKDMTSSTAMDESAAYQKYYGSGEYDGGNALRNKKAGVSQDEDPVEFLAAAEDVRVEFEAKEIWEETRDFYSKKISGIKDRELRRSALNEYLRKISVTRGELLIGAKSRLFAPQWIISNIGAIDFALEKERHESQSRQEREKRERQWYRAFEKEPRKAHSGEIQTIQERQGLSGTTGIEKSVLGKKDISSAVYRLRNPDELIAAVNKSKRELETRTLWEQVVAFYKEKAAAISDKAQRRIVLSEYLKQISLSKKEHRIGVSSENKPFVSSKWIKNNIAVIELALAQEVKTTGSIQPEEKSDRMLSRGIPIVRKGTSVKIDSVRIPVSSGAKKPGFTSAESKALKAGKKFAAGRIVSKSSFSYPSHSIKDPVMFREQYVRKQKQEQSLRALHEAMYSAGTDEKADENISRIPEDINSWHMMVIRMKIMDLYAEEAGLETIISAVIQILTEQGLPADLATREMAERIKEEIDSEFTRESESEEVKKQYRQKSEPEQKPAIENRFIPIYRKAQDKFITLVKKQGLKEWKPREAGIMLEGFFKDNADFIRDTLGVQTEQILLDDLRGYIIRTLRNDPDVAAVYAENIRVHQDILPGTNAAQEKSSMCEEMEPVSRKEQFVSKRLPVMEGMSWDEKEQKLVYKPVVLSEVKERPRGREVDRVAEGRKAFIKLGFSPTEMSGLLKSDISLEQVAGKITALISSLELYPAIRRYLVQGMNDKNYASIFDKLEDIENTLKEDNTITLATIEFMLKLFYGFKDELEALVQEKSPSRFNNEYPYEKDFRFDFMLWLKMHNQWRRLTEGWPPRLSVFSSDYLMNVYRGNQKRPGIMNKPWAENFGFDTPEGFENFKKLVNAMISVITSQEHTQKIPGLIKEVRREDIRVIGYLRFDKLYGREEINYIIFNKNGSALFSIAVEKSGKPFAVWFKILRQMYPVPGVFETHMDKFPMHHIMPVFFGDIESENRFSAAETPHGHKSTPEIVHVQPEEIISQEPEDREKEIAAVAGGEEAWTELKRKVLAMPEWRPRTVGEIVGERIEQLVKNKVIYSFDAAGIKSKIVLYLRNMYTPVDPAPMPVQSHAPPSSGITVIVSPEKSLREPVSREATIRRSYSAIQQTIPQLTPGDYAPLVSLLNPSALNAPAGSSEARAIITTVLLILNVEFRVLVNILGQNAVNTALGILTENGIVTGVEVTPEGRYYADKICAGETLGAKEIEVFRKRVSGSPEILLSDVRKNRFYPCDNDFVEGLAVYLASRNPVFAMNGNARVIAHALQQEYLAEELRSSAAKLRDRKELIKRLGEYLENEEQKISGEAGIKGLSGAEKERFAGDILQALLFTDTEAILRIIRDNTIENSREILTGIMSAGRIERVRAFIRQKDYFWMVVGRETSALEKIDMRKPLISMFEISSRQTIPAAAARFAPSGDSIFLDFPKTRIGAERKLIAGMLRHEAREKKASAASSLQEFMFFTAGEWSVTINPEIMGREIWLPLRISGFTKEESLILIFALLLNPSVQEWSRRNDAKSNYMYRYLVGFMIEFGEIVKTYASPEDKTGGILSLMNKFWFLSLPENSMTRKIEPKAYNDGGDKNSKINSQIIVMRGFMRHYSLLGNRKGEDVTGMTPDEFTALQSAYRDDPGFLSRRIAEEIGIGQKMVETVEPILRKRIEGHSKAFLFTLYYTDDSAGDISFQQIQQDAVGTGKKITFSPALLAFAGLFEFFWKRNQIFVRKGSIRKDLIKHYWPDIESWGDKDVRLRSSVSVVPSAAVQKEDKTASEVLFPQSKKHLPIKDIITWFLLQLAAVRAISLTDEDKITALFDELDPFEIASLLSGKYKQITVKNNKYQVRRSIDSDSKWLKKQAKKLGFTVTDANTVVMAEHQFDGGNRDVPPAGDIDSLPKENIFSVVHAALSGDVQKLEAIFTQPVANAVINNESISDKDLVVSLTGLFQSLREFAVQQEDKNIWLNKIKLEVIPGIISVLKQRHINVLVSWGERQFGNNAALYKGFESDASQLSEAYLVRLFESLGSNLNGTSNPLKLKLIEMQLFGNLKGNVNVRNAFKRTKSYKERQKAVIEALQISLDVFDFKKVSKKKLRKEERELVNLINDESILAGFIEELDRVYAEEKNSRMKQGEQEKNIVSQEELDENTVRTRLTGEPWADLWNQVETVAVQEEIWKWNPSAVIPVVKNTGFLLNDSSLQGALIRLIRKGVYLISRWNVAQTLFYPGMEFNEYEAAVINNTLSRPIADFILGIESGKEDSVVTLVSDERLAAEDKIMVRLLVLLGLKLTKEEIVRILNVTLPDFDVRVSRLQTIGLITGDLARNPEKKIFAALFSASTLGEFELNELRGVENTVSAVNMVSGDQRANSVAGAVGSREVLDKDFRQEEIRGESREKKIIETMGVFREIIRPHLKNSDDPDVKELAEILIGLDGELQNKFFIMIKNVKDKKRLTKEFIRTALLKFITFELISAHSILQSAGNKTPGKPLARETAAKILRDPKQVMSLDSVYDAIRTRKLSGFGMRNYSETAMVIYRYWVRTVTEIYLATEQIVEGKEDIQRHYFRVIPSLVYLMRNLDAAARVNEEMQFVFIIHDDPVIARAAEEFCGRLLAYTQAHWGALKDVILTTGKDGNPELLIVSDIKNQTVRGNLSAGIVNLPVITWVQYSRLGSAEMKEKLAHGVSVIYSVDAEEIAYMIKVLISHKAFLKFLALVEQSGMSLDEEQGFVRAIAMTNRFSSISDDLNAGGRELAQGCRYFMAQGRPGDFRIPAGKPVIEKDVKPIAQPIKP
ncbi:MAG: TFIIB-type zinc ribbon-containing protein, partial [Candidatus Omnitrophica bacterium]|nr:TFIIB-type zinc ribbon-containing protein [Candidatus Omnitrophota bacterium]